MLSLAPALLGLALGASAHLEQGQGALRDLDYQRAESEFQRARLEPGLSRAELLTLLESYGAVEAVLGHHDAAIASFRELLNLDPAHVPPAKWAPKERTPFFEAKSWQSEHLALELKEAPPITAAGQVTGLQFELTADALSLARTLRVHLVGVPIPVDAPVSGPGKLKVAVSAQGAIQYWAELLDEHQAILISIGDGAHPQHVLLTGGDHHQHPGPVDSDVDALRPVEYILGGGGVVMLAVGGILGLQVRSDQNQLVNPTLNSAGAVTSITRARAMQLDSQAKTDAVIADVLFGAGGVAAAAGLGLWVGGMFVSATPEPKGAGVAVSMVWP